MTLKEARTRKGYTKVDTCVALGVSLPTYSLWEKGVGTPNPENAEKVRKLFGDVEELRQNGGG